MANINSVAASQNFSQINPIAESAIPSSPGGTTRLILGPPIGAIGTGWDGKMFTLNLAIKITGGTTTNYTSKLYWSNSVNTDLTTFTGDIALAAPSAFSVNSTTKMYILNCNFVWDSTSQRLVGNGWSMPDVQFNVPGATSVATGVTDSSKLKFFATGIFSVSNAANVATVTDFSLSQA